MAHVGSGLFAGAEEEPNDPIELLEEDNWLMEGGFREGFRFRAQGLRGRVLGLEPRV